jgi:hypothetical protein
MLNAEVATYRAGVAARLCADAARILRRVTMTRYDDGSSHTGTMQRGRYVVTRHGVSRVMLLFRHEQRARPRDGGRTA